MRQILLIQAYIDVAQSNIRTSSECREIRLDHFIHNEQDTFGTTMEHIHSAHVHIILSTKQRKNGMYL